VSPVLVLCAVPERYSPWSSESGRRGLPPKDTVPGVRQEYTSGQEYELRPSEPGLGRSFQDL